MDEDDRDAKQGDPDRAAILARRRRFIALAISGLATAGCKRPSPEPCLSVAHPNDSEDPDDPEATPSEPGPFVEDPGEPLESETGEGETGEGETDTGETDTGELMPVDPHPNVCLKVAAPRPCLNQRNPSPRTCLLMID